MDKSQQEALFSKCVEQHRALFGKVASAFAEGVDREDLLQEILISVWRALPAFRGDAKLSTFAYRVAHNCALTWSRSRSRRWEREESVAEGLFEQAASTHEPEDHVAALFECLRALPEFDRSLVTLSFDGLSHREIGEITGASEGNVSVRLHRVRNRLKTMLKKKGFGS